MSETTLAIQMVPESYRSLPMLRLFLPFVDSVGRIRRWSEYADDLDASASWHEVWQRHVEARGEDDAEPTPMWGFLDPMTADALRDVLAGHGVTRFQCLRWVGYGEALNTGSRSRVAGHEYYAGVEPVESAFAGDRETRVPEFGHDDAGVFAWGGHLYPDSLIIAAEGGLFRKLTADPRLDTASVHKLRGVLPISSGD